MVVISYLLQILFHEIGHMLAGVLTGWRLLFLQFFHVVLKKDKSISLSIVPSSACRCIMSPKTLKCNSQLYTLGGLIVNLMITSISFYSMLSAGYHVIQFLIAMCLFSSGIALIMINGVPRINHICNDMACFLLTRSNRSTMLSHNNQFIIAEHLTRGKSYCEIDYERFEVAAYTEINDITAYSILLKFYYHMNRDEFMTAKNTLLSIKGFNKVSKNVQGIYKLELFYLYMILSIYGYDSFQSSVLPHGDEEEQYLIENTAIGDVHVYRVKAIYATFTRIRECDINGAKESLYSCLHILKSMPCIYPGEKLFCEDQLGAILNMLNRRMAIEEVVL